MAAERVPIEATKTISIGGGRLDPSIAVELEILHTGALGSPRIDALVAIEWSTMLLGGGHNPAAWHEVAGHRIRHDDAATSDEVRRLVAGNDQLGITVETTVDRPVAAWISPIETVSNSEGGFELVYQGSATILVAPLHLAPGERFRLQIEQQVAIDGERFAATDPQANATGAAVEVESSRR
jgi:alpha-amylase